MSEDQNSDPGKRLREIISSNRNDSPITRLPRMKRSAEGSTKNTRNLDALRQDTSTSQRGRDHNSIFKGLKFGPPFWTVTGILSLLVNAVLIVTLIGVLRFLGKFQVTPNDVGAGLLGGLYSNFEKMERAHITTSIPIESTIPVQFDLTLNQETSVILSQDVTIDDALVTVQTGGLNITQARTTIVLPQGTNLPIILDLTVPVNTTVPVVMNVPVDIALASTDLGTPFAGLRETIKPIYCMVEPNALNLDGNLICK